MWKETESDAKRQNFMKRDKITWKETSKAAGLSFETVEMAVLRSQCKKPTQETYTKLKETQKRDEPVWKET